MKSEKVDYQVKVNKQDHDNFLQVCEKQQKDNSQLIGAFMKAYIKLDQIEKGKKLKIESISFGLLN
ncbi:MAG TPA: hypothetical protein ENJ44_04955 [Oceanospirillales bacterium]|nr:hypothetical protein [Oceanospirillales bacterium]